MQQIFILTTTALMEKPQDFLGEIYQRLQLQNKSNGEFFTPMHIAEMMALVSLADSEEIKEKGYISICEPTCGSGVMLIGAIKAITKFGYNPSEVIYFQATDINRICYNMCYIQLSALHIAGEVRWGDTIRNEIWEVRKTPLEQIYRRMRYQTHAKARETENKKEEISAGTKFTQHDLFGKI